MKGRITNGDRHIPGLIHHIGLFAFFGSCLSNIFLFFRISICDLLGRGGLFLRDLLHGFGLRFFRLFFFHGKNTHGAALSQDHHQSGTQKKLLLSFITGLFHYIYLRKQQTLFIIFIIYVY